MISEAEFNQLAEQGYNRIPVMLETFADLDTPLSIYLKLANQPYTYLLESVQGGERFGRYSFIGLASPTRIAVYGRTVLALTGHRISDRRDDANPMAFVTEFMSRFRVPKVAELPRFCGGLVGCFGYDTVRYIEPKLAQVDKPDPLGTPDVLLLLSEEIAIVDNLSGKLTLVVYAEPGVPGAYKKAQAAPEGSARPAARAGLRFRTTARRRRSPRPRAAARSSSRRPCAAPRSTSSTATSCRWCCRSA